MKIRIVATGGTFDKEYDEINGALFFRDTHLPEMLALGRCRLDVVLHRLFMVDSLEMTDSDRNLILEHCREAVETRIVITHGTDSMEQTANLLGQSADPKMREKTIILTGAMIPYKFGSSDGLFNLGSAVAFAQALPPGVYVAMNGRVFNWDNVTKDRVYGEFREKKAKPVA